MTYSFSALAFAQGQPTASGALKQQNSDFRVDELMPVTLSGEGEHLWLKVEKDGSNTDWVAQQIASQLGIRPMQVSYAGLKDRHAVTTQWFSVHLPGQADPHPDQLKHEEFRVLASQRHERKLKRGALAGNAFTIRLRSLSGDIDMLLERLETIRQQGVPNYFGEQRFGREMSNLQRAERMFRGEFRKLKKSQRSIYLSAARSWIFNQVLSERVLQSSWNHPLPGDVFMLDGKSACFTDEDSESIGQRISQHEIHPTGPLWGDGQSLAQSQVAELEQRIAQAYPQLADGLVAARLKPERRALRLLPRELEWQLEADVLTLQFHLPAGAYATMVIRECLRTQSDNPLS